MSGIATELLLKMTGVDNTAASFASLEKNANRAVGQLRKAFAAVGAGIGAALSVRSVAKTIAELGELSDRAQAASASAADLTRLSEAMGILGIKGASLDGVSHALAKMAKETGNVGVAGFEETLKAIASLESEQQRATELVRVFGREAGLNYLPLVRQGADGVADGLMRVVAAMPAVSDAAANAGDAVKDSTDIVTRSIAATWKDAIGSIAAQWEQFTGSDFRTAAAKAAAYLDYYMRIAVRTVAGAIANAALGFERIGNRILGEAKAAAFKVKELWADAFQSPEAAAAARESAAEAYRALRLYAKGGEARVEFDFSDLDERLQNALGNAAKLGEAYAKAATASVADAVAESGGETIAETAKAAVRTIRDAARNTLTDAGSYAAFSLRRGSAGSVFGAAPSAPVSGGGSAPASLAECAKRLASIDQRLERLGVV